MNTPRSLILIASIALITGCSSSSQRQQDATVGGAVLGGIAGAVIGHQLDPNSGKWVGGAVGAATGAAIGHDATEGQYYYDEAPPPRQRYRGRNEYREYRY